MSNIRIILERKVLEKHRAFELCCRKSMEDLKTGGVVGGAVSGVIDSTISAVQGVKDPMYTFIGTKIKSKKVQNGVT